MIPLETSDSENPTYWFEHDRDAVAKEQQLPPREHTSWYARFASVANTVVRNISYYNHNILTLSGKKTELTPHSLLQIIASVPTRSVDGRGQWPIEQDGLEGWTGYFTNARLLQPEHDDDADTRAIQSFKNGVPQLPDESAVEQVVTQTHEQRDALRVNFQQGMEAANIDTDGLSIQNFLSADSFPSAKISHPLPPYYAKYLFSDIYDETALHSLRLDMEIRRLGMIQYHIQNQITA